MFQLQYADLRKLNSLTKYPSIPTYHVLGEKGRLTDGLSEDLASQQVIATEKVDGTNSRIIFTPDGAYVIGSREELLHAQGDLIFNPVLDIVETVRPLADSLVGRVLEQIGRSDCIATVYVETYGGKIGSNAKQYSSERSLGYRLFDVSIVPLAKLDEPLEAIAAWREDKGQDYLTCEQLAAFAEANEIPGVPQVFTGNGSELPRDIEGMLEFLRATIPRTHSALDAGAKGQPEGLVVRTSDRRQIAKIRFEDYERTLKARARTK